VTAVVGSTFGGLLRSFAGFEELRPVGSHTRQWKGRRVFPGKIETISGKSHEEECDELPAVHLPAILAGNPNDDAHVGKQRGSRRFGRTSWLHSLRENSAGVFQH
jgi:hypothetical protein